LVHLEHWDDFHSSNQSLTNKLTSQRRLGDNVTTTMDNLQHYRKQNGQEHINLDQDINKAISKTQLPKTILMISPNWFRGIGNYLKTRGAIQYFRKYFVANSLSKAYSTLSKTLLTF
jgi:hypothetical protein